MQRLTGGNLVPSSMSCGNTVYDDPQLAMTAPGSPGVNDYSEHVKDVLPQPQLGEQLPVGHPGRQQHVSVSHAGRGGSFSAVDISGSGWKEVS